jgi:hypothetical protein
MRSMRNASVCLALAGTAIAATVVATAFAVAAGKPDRGVPGTRQQIFEAWLAADATVVGVYAGVDSTLGDRYHRAAIEQVWSGSPAPGPLVFKAPRGLRARPGERALFFLWERLAGAPDSYLEEAKSRHGDAVWTVIGHDSLAAYLLPFAAYSYPLDGDRLVLRGQSAFPTSIPIGRLTREVAGWEVDHSPGRLYARAAVVVRARVAGVAVEPRSQHGIVVEWRVRAELTPLETYKGTPPDGLVLSYISFPRAPRLRSGEDVVLFLARNDAGLYLAAGKRAVFHVVGGEVVEAGRPLAEFVKLMRALEGPAGSRP